MRLDFTVDIGDGPLDVVVRPFAIIGYEREHRTTVRKLAVDGVGVAAMAELCWRQLVLEDRYTGDLDAFERSLVDIRMEDAPDPTSASPEASSGSSSSSPSQPGSRRTS